jgi:hypothetical protein
LKEACATTKWASTRQVMRKIAIVRGRETLSLIDSMIRLQDGFTFFTKRLIGSRRLFTDLDRSC